MKIIGLTGGIGTGKSTVSGYLVEKNIPVIDADQIAHDITMPGMPTVKKLAAAFGRDVVSETGELNRKALAAIAFASDENKKKLDEITHGAITVEMNRQLREAEASGVPLAVIDVPLLVETGMQSMCDFVWVVTASYEVKMARIAMRDGMSEDEILARMSKQLPDEIRNKYADELIDNSGGKEELYIQIERLLEKYV